MAMGGGGGADINVTPLIDILLVLIIIFMVIQPAAPKGLEALVPQPPKEKHPDEQPDSKTIVVQVLNSGGVPVYKINETTFPKEDIAPELTKIFEVRQEKVMFIKGDKDLTFGPIAEAISFGHQADVTNIGIITPQVEAGN